jgi:hypothetical protein
MLEDLEFPPGTIDNDILIISKECSNLQHVSFASNKGAKTRITARGLHYLRHAKSLSSITAGKFVIDRLTRTVAAKWSTELPILERVVFGINGSLEAVKRVLGQQMRDSGGEENMIERLCSFVRRDLPTESRCYHDMTAMRMSLETGI